MMPSVAQMEAFIRREAARLGIDPEIAVRVARSEGLRANTWQSDLQQPYGRERSYGPFQLHVDPTGKRPGMGNEFMRDTGLDPADPANWEASTMYALKKASEGGWGPWMGAIKAGVTGKMGIGGQPAAQPPAAPPGLLDGGGPSDSLSAPVRTAPSEALAAPVAGEEIDWDALQKMGEGIVKKARADAAPQDQQMPWLQPQVLQPLRRVQLGKGLLG
jgi:hypothetical protein